MAKCYQRKIRCGNGDGIYNIHSDFSLLCLSVYLSFSLCFYLSVSLPLFIYISIYLYLFSLYFLFLSLHSLALSPSLSIFLPSLSPCLSPSLSLSSLCLSLKCLSILNSNYLWYHTISHPFVYNFDSCFIDESNDLLKLYQCLQ